MKKRGYKINKWDNYNNYFEDCVKDIWINEYINELAFDEHNEEYFMICYYNLMEKHLRGQKDFSNEIWNEIVKLKEKLYEKEI
jgi:predicted solute-binding protein